MAAGFLEGWRQWLNVASGLALPSRTAIVANLNSPADEVSTRSRQTIFALSSGRPPAAIAIVRVSGPAAFETLSALTNKPLPGLRTMTLATISDPQTGAALDRALVVGFAGAASVTGEPLVELHLHGSIAVVTAVLNVLGRMPALRLAQPGEFTRQAFDNGKLDLTEVEGLADLIAATTEEQRVRALDSARGGMREAVERWRHVVLDALASIEAELDFADEQADVTTAAALDGQTAVLDAVRREVDATLSRGDSGERVRDGLTIAIIGEPNVGKSSLLNVLARRDVAIVSAAPGTTRDIIELPFELGGFALTLIDTAGLRADTSDAAELEGVARARHRAAVADLVLHVCTAAPVQPLGQVVVNKIDLSGLAPGLHENRLHVSAATGDGIVELQDWIADWARSVVPASEFSMVSTRRQLAALQIFRLELGRSLDASELVLKAEALRAGLVALSSLSGRYDNEEILDQVFSRFCIGK